MVAADFRMVGCNATILADAPRMTFGMDPWARSAEPASLSVVRGTETSSNVVRVARVVETGDSLGVAYVGGPLSNAAAYLSLQTSDGSNDVTRLRVGSDGVRVPGNLNVVGGITAGFYAGLADSYLSTTPFMPPSAAALNHAYLALSNQIGTGGGGGGGGTGSGSNVGYFGGAAGNESVVMGPVECASLYVDAGGSVTAFSYTNLIQDYMATQTDMPPSVYALHAAYAQLSNAFESRLYALGLGPGTGGAVTLPGSNPVGDTLMQTDLWLRSDDLMNRLRFDYGGVFSAYGGTAPGHLGPSSGWGPTGPS